MKVTGGKSEHEYGKEVKGICQNIYITHDFPEGTEAGLCKCIGFLNVK